MSGAGWALHCAYPDAPPSPGILTMGYDDNGRWNAIGPVPPVVHISGQLISELHFAAPDFVEVRCGWGPSSYLGDTIRITGDDRAYVYVVTRRVHRDPDTYEARWPD